MNETISTPVATFFESLRHKLCAGDFIARNRVRPQDFTRQRQLTFPVIMLLTLQKTVKSLQRHLHEFLDELAGGELFEPVTASAWTHARAKLKHTAFIELNRDCVLPFIYGEAHQTSVKRWRGHRLLGMDSSIVRLPNGAELLAQFTAVEVINNHGKTGTSYPEGRISVVYDLLNRVGLDARLEPSSTGEVALAIEQLTHAAPGDVLLSDRGFAGFPYLAWHHQRGLHYVVRCSSSSFAAAQELFRKNRAGRSLVVKLLSPRHERAELQQLGLPVELAVRFVSLRLPTGELEVLATSLLDEQKYPTGDFLALYHRRWNHETFYGVVKGRLELENFSGQTPEAVRQDFHSTVLLCNLESVLTASTDAALQEQSSAHKHPKQVNRAVSFHALKHQLVPLLYSDLPIVQVIEKLRSWFAGSPVSVRVGRKVPRRKLSLPRSYHFQRRVKKAVF
jgi:Transposase DDE domain